MLNLRTTVAVVALALTGAAAAATSNGIANGGFETAGNAESFAAGWLAAPTGNPALLASDAHSGSHSALLTVPAGFGASTLFQDSVAHGGLPSLTAANVGDTPVLSFWAKGDAGTTGNALFALRYMGISGILVDSGSQFFHQAINADGWTLITFQAAAIPAGTTSVFLEMNTAVGPLLDGRANAIYIDDIQLTLTTAVPEPQSYALLVAGLVVVGAIVRRRRA
ncbi:PEP-CTERM sorting domain-containing protein [Roseateles sp.]|uniref:PEP-CTERM sorting domain-containing protein n=1 Tax=Roseateles sp. TaxID=1971397 RepID=UPI0039EAC1AC